MSLIDTFNSTRAAIATPSSMFSGGLFQSPLPSLGITDISGGLDVLSGVMTVDLTSLQTSSNLLTTHAQDMIKQLPVNMPVCLAAANQMQALNAVQASINNTVAAALPTSCTDIFSALGPTNPFGTLLGTPSSAVSGALSSIYNSFTSVFNQMKTSLSGILGSVPATVKDMLSMLSAAGSSIKSAVTAALGSISSTLQSIAGNISSAVSGLASSITSMIADEVAAIKNAINTVMSFGMFNLLGSQHPCVATVMNNIIHPDFNRSSINTYATMTGTAFG